MFINVYKKLALEKITTPYFVQYDHTLVDNKSLGGFIKD